MYVPEQASRSEFVPIRGVRHHLRHWGEPGAPLLVALHGWMDVSASFQFVADHLARRWHVVSPDWRGFGLTGPTGVDCYEFTDYLGDLDAILHHVAPTTPVSLLGHSMGGNVGMLYAGVRPERVLAMINLEGLGLPGIRADEVPGRLATWLDELRRGTHLRDYGSFADVTARMQALNPRLPAARAAFLAEHWSVREGDRWRLRADPAHKVINRVAYRVDEVQACWKSIVAPVLWVEAADSEILRKMQAVPDYEQRLHAVADLTRAVVQDAGHMLHHDQPERVAQLVADFLGAAGR